MAGMTPETTTVGALAVTPFLHPQGCRGYLVCDPASKEALVVDAHLDLVAHASAAIEQAGFRARWVVDTHTHADHPSGAGALAGALRAERVAHRDAGHAGVSLTPDDGETLALGNHTVTVRHTPGHTPDHLVLVSDGALFSGDTLFIGGVARTDFLGGDAGQLFDSIHDVMLTLPDDTVLYPGHDYNNRVHSTIGSEKADNPWLRIEDRDRFVASLTANPPEEPANMAALLKLNREGVAIPPVISAAEAVAIVKGGGAGTVIDVRTDDEVKAAHIPGSRHIVLDQILSRVEEVCETPAPRLMLCAHGIRAENARQALSSMGVRGLTVIEGGIVGYAEAGGETAGGNLEAAAGGGGCCAALPPE